MLFLLALLAVVFATEVVLQRIGRVDLGAARRIRAGLVFVVGSGLVLLAARYVFTFSFDIEGCDCGPYFEPGPWLVGCGLAAIGGAVLMAQGVSRWHRQRRRVHEPAG